MSPKTIEVSKKLYNEKRETIEWMEKYGTNFEKNIARIIKRVAQDF